MHVAAKCGARLHVAFELAIDDDGGMGPPLGPPDQRLQPSEQFLGLVGLGEVVVDAGLKPLDPVGAAPQRGEHQDRRVDPALAQALDDLQPVHVGQHAVEDDRVERFCRRAAQTVRPAHFPDHLAAMAREQCSEIGRGVGIVLDIKQLHPEFPRCLHLYALAPGQQAHRV